MARAKSIQDLSASELYELARKREEEEQEREREVLQKKIEVLKTKKKEISARFRKELKLVEEQILALSGRKRRKGAGRGGRQQASQRVIAFISGRGKATTKEIKAHLASEGVEVANLSQLLAYLKKSGRVTSPARSVYTIAQ